MFNKVEVFSNKIARIFAEIFCKRKHQIIQDEETKKIKVTYQETIKQFEKRFELELELYEYFFFFIMSHLLEIGTTVLLGVLFNYWIFLLMVIPVFIITRSKSGGIHLWDFKSCFVTSVVLLSIGGLLAKFSQNIYIIFAAISIFLSILILPNTPKISENAQSRGLEVDKKFQKQYCNRILFFYCIQIILIFLIFNYDYNIKFISTGISSGLLIVSFISSNFGEKSINKFWNLVDKYN